MSRFKSWAARAARSLSAHLDRLRQTLERLHGRLRAAVAEAVSGSAAGAVQDAVLVALLAPDVSPSYESQEYRTLSRPYEQPHYRDGPSWSDPTEDPYRPSWQRDRYEDDPDHFERHEEDDDPPPVRPPEPSSESTGRRWGQALAVGCQATAWWLRRQSNGRFAGLLAIGVGAAAGITAYFIGPVIATAAALAGSTLGLTVLADAARRGAAVLFGVGSS